MFNPVGARGFFYAHPTSDLCHIRDRRRRRGRGQQHGSITIALLGVSRTADEGFESRPSVGVGSECVSDPIFADEPA
jgi:hypothetical protein